AGLIVELADGRVAVSQRHQSTDQASGRRQPADQRHGHVSFEENGHRFSLDITRPLHFARFETATPLKQAIFHAGMCTVGRFCRTAVRKLLQRRVITDRREAPLRLTRRFQWGGTAALRVIDTIELTSPSAVLRRMSYGTD